MINILINTTLSGIRIRVGESIKKRNWQYLNSISNIVTSLYTFSPRLGASEMTPWEGESSRALSRARQDKYPTYSLRPHISKGWRPENSGVRKLTEWSPWTLSFSPRGMGFPDCVRPEKEGKLGFCVDYQKLDLLTTQDSYQILHMDECIDLPGNAVIFSTMDPKSRYWKVEIAHSDGDKTAYMSHHGLFHFTRMNFTLGTAPETV